VRRLAVRPNSGAEIPCFLLRVAGLDVHYTSKGTGGKLKYRFVAADGIAVPGRITRIA